MSQDIEEQILKSWQKNAEQWTTAIQRNQIESRSLVTNQAIINAVLDQSPDSVLDVGCGEGWLVRELFSHIPHVVGVDLLPSLIEAAKTSGPGDFRVTSYEAISKGAINETFDSVVCNFSLLGKASVESMVNKIPTLLNQKGTFIIQTLHPVFTGGNQPYIDGWREGSWDGFSDDFVDPAPWYFRTLESWIGLLTTAQLQLTEIREPLHPESQKPASIILIAHKA